MDVKDLIQEIAEINSQIKSLNERKKELMNELKRCMEEQNTEIIVTPAYSAKYVKVRRAKLDHERLWQLVPEIYDQVVQWQEFSYVKIVPNKTDDVDYEEKL